MTTEVDPRAVRVNISLLIYHSHKDQKEKQETQVILQL